MTDQSDIQNVALKRAVIIVALANLAYFFVEFVTSPSQLDARTAFVLDIADSDYNAIQCYYSDRNCQFTHREKNLYYHF